MFALTRLSVALPRSVRQMARGEHGLAQARTVVLIGILAAVRKFMTQEIESTSSSLLADLPL